MWQFLSLPGYLVPVWPVLKSDGPQILAMSYYNLNQMVYPTVVVPIISYVLFAGEHQNSPLDSALQL